MWMYEKDNSDVMNGRLIVRLFNVHNSITLNLYSGTDDD